MANMNVIVRCRAEWARIDAARLAVREALNEHRPMSEIYSLMARADAESMLSHDIINTLTRSMW